MFLWLKRAFVALLSISLISGICGAIYQTVASSRDAERFHTPGQLINIGNNRRLSLECRGSGSPTVILESGLGSPAIFWNGVLQGVAPVTRVCAYDRAGYGYSDPGPFPRTTNAIVDDLERLLENAGEKGPFLLAGHSFGGFNIRVYAARHRPQVAGMIFIDSSHPDQGKRMPADIRRKEQILNFAAQSLPLLARIGVVRIGFSMSGSSTPELTYLESQPKYAAAMISELNAFDQSGEQTKAAAANFGDLPIIVLTAGKDGLGNPAMFALWQNELQPELAQLSNYSRRHIVEGATHLIPTEKPQAVVEAVREMLAFMQHQ